MVGAPDAAAGAVGGKPPVGLNRGGALPRCAGRRDAAQVNWPNRRYTLTPLVAAAVGVSMALALAGLLAVALLVRRHR